MRKFFVATLFLIVILNNVSGQSIEIERNNLKLKFKSGKISQNEYQLLGKELSNIIRELDSLPKFPYNWNTQQVEFKFVKDLQGIDKKTIYNRIMERSSILFGSLNSALQYSNFESGKIILKGWFNIFHKADTQSFWGGKKEIIKKKKCIATYIFTLKDNKLKIEVTDIVYEYKFDSYFTTSSYYVPERVEDVSLFSIYPITNDDPIYWKSNLDMIKQTALKIDSFVDDIYFYIGDHQNDYGF